jgi:hypothetical protein
MVLRFGAALRMAKRPVLQGPLLEKGRWATTNKITKMKNNI